MTRILLQRTSSRAFGGAVSRPAASRTLSAPTPPSASPPCCAARASSDTTSDSTYLHGAVYGRTLSVRPYTSAPRAAARQYPLQRT